MKVSVIVSQVAAALNDVGMTKWTEPGHIRRFNDAQRAVVDHRPESVTVTKSVPLSDGAHHSLPSGNRRLLAVTQNMGLDGETEGSAIRLGDKAALDRFDPGWASADGAAVIVEYMPDDRSPTDFYSYPPADGTTEVRVMAVEDTVDVAELTDDITLPDGNSNALREYMLYLCFARDSEMTPNYIRAERHLINFANDLGVKLVNGMRVSPKNPSNKE